MFSVFTQVIGTISQDSGRQYIYSIFPACVRWTRTLARVLGLVWWFLSVNRSLNRLLLVPKVVPGCFIEAMEPVHQIDAMNMARSCFAVRCWPFVILVASVTRISLITLVFGVPVIHVARMNNVHPHVSRAALGWSVACAPWTRCLTKSRYHI